MTLLFVIIVAVIAWAWSDVGWWLRGAMLLFAALWYGWTGAAWATTFIGHRNWRLFTREQERFFYWALVVWPFTLIAGIGKGIFSFLSGRPKDSG